MVRVRANGETLLEQAVTPGAVVEFDAPAEGGWVRASRLLPEAEAAKQAPGCEPNGLPASTCAYDQMVGSLTSPIYSVGRAGRPQQTSFRRMRCAKRAAPFA